MRKQKLPPSNYSESITKNAAKMDGPFVSWTVADSPLCFKATESGNAPPCDDTL